MKKRTTNPRSHRKPPKHTNATSPSVAQHPRTAAQYHGLPERSKDTLERALKVISKVRTEKLSLTKASLEIGISPRTVKRWAGSALQKRANGKWSAKKSDRLLRILKIPSASGAQEIGVRGSRQATQLADYWNAVQRYLETGDASQLAKFRGKSIKDANGNQIPLITDRATLRHLGSAGVLSFESLYSRAA